MSSRIVNKPIFWTNFFNYTRYRCVTHFYFFSYMRLEAHSKVLLYKSATPMKFSSVLRPGSLKNINQHFPILSGEKIIYLWDVEVAVAERRKTAHRVVVRAMAAVPAVDVTG